MPNTDLCFLSAAELSSLVSTKEISPVEIVEALLTRIETLNKTLRAYIHVCSNDARSDARRAETDIRNGNYIGPLHGIPVAYKDIYNVRGLPTTAGSKLLANYIAPEDSVVASNLRQAGAICIGKTNTWEFASGSMEVFGEAKNPWNTRMVTGGSSSGSGAALASCLTPLATGTDTGGSVRTPAAYCGLVGLKPTLGRLSCSGIVPLSATLDHPGPMARRARDTAMLFYGMLGGNPPNPVIDSTENLKDFRIGRTRSFFFQTIHPEVDAAVQKAIGTLKNLGASIHEIELPCVELGPAASFTIAYTDAFNLHRKSFMERSNDYTLSFLCKISSTAFFTAEELLISQQICKIIRNTFTQVLKAVDIIVTPSTAYPAHPIDSNSPQSDMRSFARPISLTGLPALSMPCGFTRSGLPIGLQLIGRAGKEKTLFQVARAYEQAIEWHKRRPSIQAGELWEPALAEEETVEAIDARWVIDAARRKGLNYIDEKTAESIAPYVSSVKASLRAARSHLKHVNSGALWGF